ncbi:MAG: amidohydrolase family protein [Chitinophagaceae bacterium]
MRKPLLLIFFLSSFSFLFAQQKDSFTLLIPARVFDGDVMHEGWQVLVKNNVIEAIGEAGKLNAPASAKVIQLKDATLLPGLIEGHSHLFLHPYNETSWNDQVLKETRVERTARAVNGAKATLLAGFTTVRDLGTEGAMYDDAALKKTIEKGVIPGPRMIVATRAIVAKGTYGPRSENPDIIYPQGAAEVGGRDDIINEVRTQIGKGADLIKIYADYRWGRNGESKPTFSAEEIGWISAIAQSGGREVVAHAATAEGMRRAIMGGVSTIEHGDEGTEEVFKLMVEKKVALCPTLAAGDAIAQYGGWRKGVDPEPQRITAKRNSFQAALKAGVTICMGGDVGVFPHGENAREMELMVAYGMKPIDVLRSATSVNADVFDYASKIGRIKKGLYADLVAVEGDPSKNITLLRTMLFVMKGGVIYKMP